MNTEQLIQQKADELYLYKEYEGIMGPVSRRMERERIENMRKQFIEAATFGASLKKKGNTISVSKMEEKPYEFLLSLNFPQVFPYEDDDDYEDSEEYAYIKFPEAVSAMEQYAASLNGWVSVKEDLPNGELLTKKVEAIDEYGNVSIIFGKSVIIRKLQFTHWRKIIKP